MTKRRAAWSLGYFLLFSGGIAIGLLVGGERPGDGDQARVNGLRRATIPDLRYLHAQTRQTEAPSTTDKSIVTTTPPTTYAPATGTETTAPAETSDDSPKPPEDE